MICLNCGKNIPNKYEYCPHCGYKIKIDSSDNGKKEKTSKEEIDTGKGMAIVCYFNLLVIIPLIFEKSNNFVRYHINQGLSLCLFTIVTGVIKLMLNDILLYSYIFAILMALLIIIMVVIGIKNVCSGEEKPLPIIGNFNLLGLIDKLKRKKSKNNNLTKDETEEYIYEDIAEEEPQNIDIDENENNFYEVYSEEKPVEDEKGNIEELDTKNIPQQEKEQQDNDFDFDNLLGGPVKAKKKQKKSRDNKSDVNSNTSSDKKVKKQKSDTKVNNTKSKEKIKGKVNEVLKDEPYNNELEEQLENFCNEGIDEILGGKEKVKPQETVNENSNKKKLTLEEIRKKARQQAKNTKV
nr:hypothetical protein [uncultured Ruminococcus sp.]